MAQFLTPTNLQVLRGQFREGRQLFQVVDNPVRYASDVLNCIVEVPVGYVTDLASVPRWPFIFDLAGGLADEPAVVHDWLYTVHAAGGKPITRPQADATLREAISVSDGSHAPGWLMWAGVRLGGSRSWDGAGPIQLPSIQRIIDSALTAI